MSYQIGIDLGTTFSAVSYIDEQGQPNIIRNRDGSTTTPSVIYFDGESPIVGEEAKERQAFGDTEVASFFKRSIGEDGFVEYFNDQTYTSTDLSAILLKNLKQIAEEALHTTITEAVITVPAYFENKQREETIEAGKKAGLKVKAIINEPTAVALAYGINETIDQHLIVYDLGGGTFDVTIVEISAEQIKVLATGGDHSLGGKDWDDRIVTYVAEQFEAEHGIDPLDNLDTMNDLLVKGEQAKKMLTARTTTSISVVCDGMKETYKLSRELFEDLTSDLMERTWSLIDRTLQEANLSWRHISDVLLVGGSTRMPMVHTYIEGKIGKPPLKGVHPDEAIAIGAAIKANLPSDDPNDKQPTFSLGASKNIVDVMSHSLGMVVMNKNKTKYVNSIILYKNEAIPVQKKRTYQIQTNPGNKNVLEVYVTQGESNRPYECSIIGKYIVTNIEHQANGLAKIEVSYAYDQNGVIQVSAIDQEKGTTLSVKRENVTGDLSWLSEAPKEEEKVEVRPELSVMIALDLSGSMRGIPLQEAQRAAMEFIDKMDLSYTSIGLIGFARDAKVITPLTSDYHSLKNSVDSYLSVYQSGELGYTTDAEPFSLANEALRDKDGSKFIIVLTDGLWSRQFEAIEQVNTNLREDVEVIAVGFGSADEQFLKQIATTSENALFTDVTELVSSFSKIAQELSLTDNYQSKKKSGFLSIFR